MRPAVRTQTADARLAPVPAPRGGIVSLFRSYTLGAQRSRQAIDLARRHGWTEEPAAGVAYLALGMAMVALHQARMAELARIRSSRARLPRQV
jgi:hypothetical protein